MAHLDIVIRFSCWNGSRGKEKTEWRRTKSRQYFHEETPKYSACVYGVSFKSWAANEAKPPTFLTVKAGVFLWVRGHSWGALTGVSCLMSTLLLAGQVSAVMLSCEDFWRNLEWVRDGTSELLFLIFYTGRKGEFGSHLHLIAQKIPSYKT